MAEQTKQIDRIGALANRLRLLQIDYADQTEQVRRGYLTEEVRRVLAPVAPDQRPAFLADLQARFPTWDDKVDLDSPPPAAATPGQESDDPTALVDKLVGLCKSLPDDA